MCVFVDLYLKACQLHDQAELLGGRPLTDQLSGRLAAVEETLAALRKLPAVRQDAEAEETAAPARGPGAPGCATPSTRSAGLNLRTWPLLA